MSDKPIWIQIAFPFGILFALVLIILGWLFDALDYRLALAVMAGEACVWILSWAVGHRVASLLRKIETAVRGFARGGTAEFSKSGSRETQRLTQAIERMLFEMEARAESMEERQKRLASILSHLSDGIIIVDASGMVLMDNPAASDILGVRRRTRGNRSLAQLVGQHQIITLWRKCREGEILLGESVQFKRGGRFVRATATRLPDHPGHCLVTIQDVTEMRLADEMRKDFISNISHELRTPLASMKILADTLRGGALEDPEVASRFLDKMDREIDALVQMVEELLELSRIESGRVPLRIEPVSLANVVLPPVERLRAQIERAGLELQIDLPTPPPIVLADPERFPRVVTNLVHNAIKFTGPRGRIRVFARRHGDEVIVGVSDTGIGIPKEALPRIFERFYKSDKSRRSQGTGLGLSISKHLVQAHGGRIWAESEEGRGSTFYFTVKEALPGNKLPKPREFTFR